MQAFIPPLSPTKVRMLSPSRRDIEPSVYEDDVIEIPDSAGLSEETRNAIYNVWINDDDLEADNAYMDRIHYLKVPFPQSPFINVYVGLSSDPI